MLRSINKSTQNSKSSIHNDTRQFHEAFVEYKAHTQLLPEHNCFLFSMCFNVNIDDNLFNLMCFLLQYVQKHYYNLIKNDIPEQQ